MNKKNIEKFVNSDHASVDEQTFLDSTMNQYYKQKQRLKYSNILEDKFNIKPTEINNIEPESASKNSLIRNIIIVLSSLILIAILSFFLLKTDTTNTQPAIYASMDNVYIEMGGVTRGVVVEESERIINMSKAYADKNFDVVIEEFNSIVDKSVLKDVSLTEVAVSFASTYKYEEAISIFNALLTSTSEARKQEIRWTLINLYLIMDNKPEALKTFQSMKTTDYKYSESQKLINN